MNELAPSPSVIKLARDLGAKVTKEENGIQGREKISREEVDSGMSVLAMKTSVMSSSCESQLCNCCEGDNDDTVIFFILHFCVCDCLPKTFF